MFDGKWTSRPEPITTHYRSGGFVKDSRSRMRTAEAARHPRDHDSAGPRRGPGRDRYSAPMAKQARTPSAEKIYNPAIGSPISEHPDCGSVPPGTLPREGSRKGGRSSVTLGDFSADGGRDRLALSRCRAVVPRSYGSEAAAIQRVVGLQLPRASLRAVQVFRRKSRACVLGSEAVDARTLTRDSGPPSPRCGCSSGSIGAARHCPERDGGRVHQPERGRARRATLNRSRLSAARIRS